MKFVVYRENFYKSGQCMAIFITISALLHKSIHDGLFSSLILKCKRPLNTPYEFSL